MAMRPHPWLALSLALNAALGWGIWRASQKVPPVAAAEETPAVEEAAAVGRTNVVVRRQFFQWSEIESSDYPTFVANLRRIGCPEITVRDIIVADVNQMFAQRRAQEVISAESQWWKPEPDLDATEAAVQKMNQLEGERQELLARLLGPNWNVNFTQVSERGTVALDGPVLGKIDPETKLKVQELAVGAARKAAAYIEKQRAAKAAIDPAQMAQLRQEHRAELSKVLPPEQMEEYLLRYSANAENLRRQLSGFNATPEEFRAIFRARDQIDNDIQLHYSGNDPATARARQEMERLRDSAVEQALGPERSGLYRATADPLFREAQFLAQQTGAMPEKVLPLYQVQVEGARERARINSDRTLTAADRAAAIRTVSEQEEAARRRILELPPEPGPTQ